jgi:hypothetical protein
VIKKYLNDFLLCQLVVTLVSLPILSAWGLPLSLMSIVGNLVFLPFLTVFLILSSMVFFTELLSIPNSLFITGLNLVTKLWLHLLHYGKKEWLIGFAHPKLLTLTILLQIAANLFLHKQIKRYLLIGNYIVLLLILFIFSLASRITVEQTYFIPNANQKISISTHQDNTITITDNGFFSKKTSPEKMVNFELKPYLTQQFGTVKIKEIIEQRPGQRSFRALQELCGLFPVETVKLAYFDFKLNKNGWRAFFDLKRELSKQGIQFERFKLDKCRKAKS